MNSTCRQNLSCRLVISMAVVLEPLVVDLRQAALPGCCAWPRVARLARRPSSMFDDCLLAVLCWAGLTVVEHGHCAVVVDAFSMLDQTSPLVVDGLRAYQEEEIGS